MTKQILLDSGLLHGFVIFHFLQRHLPLKIKDAIYVKRNSVLPFLMKRTSKVNGHISQQNVVSTERFLKRLSVDQF